jgi:hypothetical protein
MPEKLWPENPGQKQQIWPDNPCLLVSGGRLSTFPCQKSYGQKIPASTVTTDMVENPAASNCRYGRKIPANNYR